MADTVKDARFVDRFPPCLCDCKACMQGDHGFCPDTKLCGRPKTYNPNEQPRRGD